MTKIILVGSGGFAKEMYCYAKKIIDIKVTGYIDKIENKELESYVPYLGDDSINLKSDEFLLLSISNIEIRKRIVNIFGEDKFYTFIHPSSIVADTSRIGIGSIICPNCIIGPNTSIGKFGLMNYNTFLPHDCKIGDYCFLAPLTNIGGYVNIGDNFFSGLSSTIIPNLNIGNNVKISAGSVVTRNLPDQGSFFGNPAIRVK